MEPAGLQIRPLEPGDRTTVQDLHRAAFPPDLAFHDLVLHRLFVHEGAINLVAVLDGEIVGYAAAIHAATGRARLYTLHVAPAAQGQGVAKGLLTELERRLTARRAAFLELNVHVENEAALGLYEQAGYEVTREEPNGYPSLEPSTGLVLRKQLPR